MKDSKFSDAQKAFILKQGADGVPVAEICRRCESACKRLPSFSVIGFQTGTTSGSFSVVGF